MPNPVLYILDLHNLFEYCNVELVYTQLYDQTALFYAIQFNIS